MQIPAPCLDQLFLKARTANGFDGQSVPTALLRQVYELACMGPTSMNTQPARFVFLHSPESRARLLPALSPGNLDKTREAPVTVIVANDTKFYEHMPQVWHKPGAKETSRATRHWRRERRRATAPWVVPGSSWQRARWDWTADP